MGPYRGDQSLEALATAGGSALDLAHGDQPTLGHASRGDELVDVVLVVAHAVISRQAFALKGDVVRRQRGVFVVLASW